MEDKDYDLTDYETSKMLKVLGWKDIAAHLWNGDDNPPTRTAMNHRQNDDYIAKRQWYSSLRYWDVKKWLWNKHGISIQVEEKKKRKHRVWIMTEDDAIQSDESFGSPIDAEISGMKKAIEYLYKQKTKRKK